MDPRKTNARRGFREREAIRRQNASQWQKEDFFPKEEKMNASINESQNKGMGPGTKLLIVLFVMLLISICVLVFVWNPFGIQVTRSLTTPPPAVVEKDSVSLLPTPVIPTEVPPTEVPPTEVPTEVPTPVPTEVPEPVAVTCDTPSIQAEVTLDGKQLSASGEYLDTTLGKRMTYTSRQLVVPTKAWNETLSAEELLAVETTWQKVKVCVPEGLTAVIFTGGFEQGIDRYETGALLSLQPGLYEFNMRNGEIVIWYPEQEKYVQDDLDRIIQQIRVGNFDIKSPLAFFAATTDLFSKIPQDLVKERNVQIAAFLEPAVK